VLVRTDVRLTITTTAFLLALAAPRSGRGAPCPPATRLRGDPALVAGVTTALGERGIVAGDPAGCPTVEVQVDRRDGRLLVSRTGDGDQPVERAVTDIRTAATVIESWVRTDVEAPLLATRTIAAPEPPPPPTVAPSIAVAARPPERGVQLFTVAETTHASDATSWFGLQVGACVMLGPACAAARARLATVTHGPGPWRQGNLDRRGVEVLLGADVPLRWRRATISPGLAGGIGWIHTHDESSPLRGAETGGLRAEAHAALSYPIHPRLAIEAVASFDLTQATHVETSSPAPLLPDEPRWLARLGAGLRFGGL
jgi:hypothetical protein